MGTHKKEKNRPTDGPTNLRVKGENFYRDAHKVKYVNMLKGGKATRNAQGKIIKAAEYQSREKPTARVAPNRKWFGNTRVIGQKALEDFRESLGAKVNDPFQVLLRRNKLPMSLLQDPTKQAKMHVLETESFGSTFGSKAQRKKPKLTVGSMEELVEKADDSNDSYVPTKDTSLLSNVNTDYIEAARGWYLQAGQSKRIWNELYKVIDSSDVVIHVLDARDPIGTRCVNVEKYIRKECPHKHLIFVLNKCDLVPTWATARWVKHLSAEYPTLAFHASITNSFGKGSLIQLLRQFSVLHSDKKQISVGFIGYPNTGKSSMINTLKAKKVCNVAPIPGETKVWQYITLMKRIYLIDCPGVVPPNADDSEADIVLKGVVRVENIQSPEDCIPDILQRVRKEYLQRTYGVRDWTDSIDFITQICKKMGKLLKGGEPDLHNVSVMILNDWLRGKIPFYTPPPERPEAEDNVDTSQKTKEEKGEKKGVHIGVDQIFRKINVSASYLPDDLKTDDAEIQKELRSDETSEDNATDASTKTATRQEDEGPDWDEVFESVVGEDGGRLRVAIEGEDDDELNEDLDSELELSDENASSGEKSDSENVEVEDEQEERKAPGNKVNGFVVKDKPTQQGKGNKRKHDDYDGDAKPQKEKRMTTNKKKIGVHYYETANVKNRNRNKKVPTDPKTLAKRSAAPGSLKMTDKKRR
ncbi:hypothetical protein BZG36_03192 [Bifiguratus adelaidae]|uniref:Nucleolar GTP-binding protein 2 n=1 Tax=Bifiguratus adelaidae TaxID=1938954 RepID=A0A261XYM5_9FUNG|nr:hypothetical protein BZG36_03192 [Bifiguratus adelaidae]